MSDSIKISIELADQAAQKSLSDFISRSSSADKAFKKMGDTGKDSFDRVSVAIGKTIGVYDIFAGNLISNVVTKAFESIKNSIGQVINEAAASEQSINNMNVALKSAGLFSKQTSEDFQEFAGELQNVTIYSDEAVMASSSLLLSLTSLGTEGIKQATQAAADLAATLNIDLSTATEMISKAINGNTTAFKKQGIEIQTASTDAGRLANTLKALESQTGAAAAQSNTYAGAIAKAKNQQSELLESLGKLYTQNTSTIASTVRLSEVYAASAKFITDNSKAIQDFGTALAISVGIIGTSIAGYYAVTAAIGLYTTATYLASTGVNVLAVASRVAWAAITGPIGLAIIGITSVVGITYALVRNWEQVKIATTNALAKTLEYAAAAAGVFSDSTSESILKKALALREEAKSAQIALDQGKLKSEQDSKTSAEDAAQSDIRRARLEADRRDLDFHNAYLLAKKQETQDLLFLSENDFYIKLADQSAKAQQAQDELNGTLSLEKLTKYQEEGLLRLTQQQELDAQMLEVQLAAQLAQAQSETDDAKRKEAVTSARQKAELSRMRLHSTQQLEIQKKKEDDTLKVDQKALSDRSTTLNLFASLQNSSNNTLATIGKAAALTQIAIATPQAVGSAFAFGTAQGGPALGYTLSAIAAAAMAAQAAQIIGIKFAEGGIVPGSSFAGDNVAARVNSGEMILNRQQQAELFKMANGSSGSQGGLSRQDVFDVLREVMQSPISVSVDGRELFNLTRDQLASGRSY